MGKPVLEKKEPNWLVFVFVSLVSAVVSVCLNGGYYTRKQSNLPVFCVCFSCLSRPNRGFHAGKQPKWPVLRLSHLSHLSHLSQGGLSGSDKKNNLSLHCRKQVKNGWFRFCLTCLTCFREGFHTKKGQIGPFCVCLTCLTHPPKTFVGPHLLGQTSTKQTPSTHWASQCPSQLPPPVGRTSTLKKRIPPDPTSIIETLP